MSALSKKTKWFGVLWRCKMAKYFNLRSYFLDIESLCGKHLIDVPIALENDNFKTAVQKRQSLKKLETILMEEF